VTDGPGPRRPPFRQEVRPALGRAADQAVIGIHLLRWVALGAVSGVLAGVSSWVFLRVLDEVTETRVDEPWLLYLLPVAGLVVGAVYHWFGGRSAQGNSLLIDQIHEPTDWVPRRMAPLVLVGTWVTHLFGGSAGREGTALQMSGSLTDAASRVLRLPPEDRRIVLAASLGGGFGAVFGVPLAGAVFAMEVQSVGRLRYEAIVPALTAALVGDLVVEGLGYEHTLRPQIGIDLDAGLALRVALAGVAFGLAGAAFAWLTHRIKAVMSRWVRFAPARTAIGGVAVVGLVLLFGREYLGLSLPLVDQALAGESAAIWVFALKILFTAVTLGAGFPGGEVTPLFVIGTTLGSALADPLDLDPVLLAAVGFVAVFAGAANVPLACTIMGVELFGAGPVVPLAIGCVVAYVCSGHQGIYTTQRVDTPKRPVRR